MVKTTEKSLTEVLENAHSGVDKEAALDLFSTVSLFLKEETKNLDLPTDRIALRETFYNIYQDALKEKELYPDDVRAEETAVGALLFIKAFDVD